MKKINIMVVLFFACLVSQAQTIFHPQIKIEFEKTIYVRQLYKELVPEWYDRIKDQLPQSSLAYFDFIGDTTKSIFKPGRELPFDPRAWRPMGERRVTKSFAQGRAKR